MKIIRGFYNFHHNFDKCVITLGNFDGVHLGHQALIKRLKHVGNEKHLPTVVMIFEPQPLEFFCRDSAPARLTSFQEKYLQIERLGVDYLFVIPFNQKIANFLAPIFIEQILIQKLQAQYVIIGDDFKFGLNRQGNATLLNKYVQQGKFEFESLPSYLLGEERVSSTAIRQVLAQSKFKNAQALLGRPYSIFGKVVYGNQLARTLGFPTANVHLHRKNPALHGVYFVEVTGQCLNEIKYGIANIRIRPTINGKHAVLEVNIFNFDQQIYGEYLDITFVEKIRDEIKFNSLEELQKQIKQDVCIAKQIQAKLSE